MTKVACVAELSYALLLCLLELQIERVKFEFSASAPTQHYIAVVRACVHRTLLLARRWHVGWGTLIGAIARACRFVERWCRRTKTDSVKRNHFTYSRSLLARNTTPHACVQEFYLDCYARVARILQHYCNLNPLLLFMLVGHRRHA